MNRFYFDHNATTPVSAESLEAMLPLLTDVYGNASSLHQFGQAARTHLDQARSHIATMLSATPAEIIFTSGGTEADNLAILGVARDGHAITTTIEHPAVLATCAQCASVTYVDVDATGVVDPDAIRRAIRPDTKIISVMHANNEIGTVQPITGIAKIARDAGIAMHSDGVQATGKIAIDVRALGVDLYSISGHKFYAPKGIGALFVRKGMDLSKTMHGGRHERGRRAGTENVAGAAGMGRAAQWIVANGPEEAAREAALRDRLEQSILDRVPGSHANGNPRSRVANTTNIRFDGIDSEPLLIALDLRGFAVSAGSACSSGVPEPSHVLTAIGLTKEQARSCVRISLGRANSSEQVDALASAVADCVAHVRKMAPAYA